VEKARKEKKWKRKFPHEFSPLVPPNSPSVERFFSPSIYFTAAISFFAAFCRKACGTFPPPLSGQAAHTYFLSFPLTHSLSLSLFISLSHSFSRFKLKHSKPYTRTKLMHLFSLFKDLDEENNWAEFCGF